MNCKRLGLLGKFWFVFFALFPFIGNLYFNILNCPFLWFENFRNHLNGVRARFALNYSQSGYQYTRAISTCLTSLSHYSIKETFDDEVTLDIRPRQRFTYRRYVRCIVFDRNVLRYQDLYREILMWKSIFVICIFSLTVKFKKRTINLHYVSCYDIAISKACRFSYLRLLLRSVFSR